MRDAFAVVRSLFPFLGSREMVLGELVGGVSKQAVYDLLGGGLVGWFMGGGISSVEVAVWVTVQ